MFPFFFFFFSYCTSLWCLSNRDFLLLFWRLTSTFGFTLCCIFKWGILLLYVICFFLSIQRKCVCFFVRVKIYLSSPDDNSFFPDKHFLPFIQPFFTHNIMKNSFRKLNFLHILYPNFSFSVVQHNFFTDIYFPTVLL